MHTYPVNSSAAISRLLALAMIVDGHVVPSEVRAMRHATFLQQAGVDDDVFDRTLRELCEDLLGTAANPCAGIVEIDPVLLDSLLLEVADPLLQICMWKTMADIVQADGRVDGREMTLVQRAARKWFGHDRATNRATASNLAG